MSRTTSGTNRDPDVVIVGGGPAGCSAGVFTARYGLDTVIFDRGRSSIRQCAYLENYPGFPAGIDVETLYSLLHDHAEEAGCAVVPELVESVDRADDGDGFLVETREGRGVAAGRVLAATRYDGTYLRPLDEGGMFAAADEGNGDEHFDRSYADEDGRTPVDGLYVASPSAEADRQAIVAAGRGARVGLALIADVRAERGYPDPVADHYDWVRREATLDDEHRRRERWREWFEDSLPEDHGLGADRRVALREADLERRFEAYLSEEAIERRTRRGQRRLLEHLDDDLVLEAARDIESERHAPSPNGVGDDGG